MKNIVLLLIFTIIFSSCQENKKKTDVTDDFEKSYKEQKDSESLPDYTEHFDSTNNLYSNYKYKVAFDAPNHWSSDTGVSEHTIFRTFQQDSAISFAINVIELKMDENEKAPDIWEMYQIQKVKMDYTYKVLIPKQFNSKVEDFRASKTYIKNKTTLKRQFKYLVRELDLEYYNTSIVYQTLIDNLSYTFSLDVPTMFYDQNPSFYDNLIRNVSFLYGKDNVNNYLNKKEN
ncbi:hypothetical protein GCM10007962_07830 [Yeosuana aromativorans]|uniref:Uncharacterized protein n=1 Tax=Yeosuana aromativorans TaxID=288019 RepID=A0A8J3BI60_9FLAO|nr:hypothetical protein [Yeosuana aromativorans]GGK15967.1 hypothetical protein GCM10007962_07830 [Yeosuana aromativorans]